MLRLNRVVLATVVLAAAGLFAQVAPASATHIPGCYGTRIEHVPLKYNTTVVGYVDLYYSSSNGGTNCVKTISAGPSAGVSKFMLAKVYRCTGSAGSTCVDGSGDSISGTRTRETSRRTPVLSASPIPRPGACRSSDW